MGRGNQVYSAERKEGRVKRCVDCKKKMVVISNVQKRCVDCRKAHNQIMHDRARVRRGERKSCGQGRGGKQNGGWKDGRSVKWYKRFKKKRCERCPSKGPLLVHHKDRNRRNSNPSNLETLCFPCHTREHKAEMDRGRGLVPPALSKSAAAA